MLVIIEIVVLYVVTQIKLLAYTSYFSAIYWLLFKF